MENKKAGKKLDKTLFILVVVVFMMVAAIFWKGGWELTVLGFEQVGQLMQMVWLRLLLGFILGGLIQVLIPSSLVAKWLGHASGLKGILIGSYAGIILPGGPYVHLPIVASMYRAGAGVGPVIAYLTGRAVLGIPLLIVWQIPFLGVEIPLARYIASLFVPPLVGLAGRAVFQVLNRSHETANKSDHKVSNVAEERDGAGNTCVTSEEEEKTEKWT